MRVHVVSHTHWDREWYLPAVRFRQRLVSMVDELLDDPPRDGASFLLDGQTVVLDDYLAVRPDRAAELTALLASGALEAGPWFVQADELIPGGEAFIRNLLAGARTLRALGVEAPPVLYCPDTFGHPATLPVLAAGFGCEVIIASRGYGSRRWPEGDAAWWTAPDGTRVLFFHLSKSGYETGAHLPHDAATAATRWKDIAEDLVPRSRVGALLLMNGADHHARQERLSEAFAAMRDAAKPLDLRASSLGAFARDVAANANDTPLPEISGELRDSYGWMWTLQGTFATRAHQKRRNARAERALIRDVEPWTALATRISGRSRKPLVDAAWRSVLLCHPHDTICGCSTDEVGRAMDARMDEAESQAAGLRTDALFDVIGHAPEQARVSREAWTPVVVVRNCAPRPRSGVAILRMTSFLADVKVGIHPDAAPAPSTAAVKPVLPAAGALQVLGTSIEDELTESPRHYPDDDLVSVNEVAAWIPEVPAYGTLAMEQHGRMRRRAIPNPARAAGHMLTNGRVSVRVHDDGRIDIADHMLGRTLEDAVRWDSRADLGDEYTPSIREPRLMPAFAGMRVLHRGPVRSAIETRWQSREGHSRISAKLVILVDANAPFVRFHVEGDNHATDHRLRVGIASDVKRPRVFADAMFGPVERVTLVITEEDARMETPLPTHPLHRYVSVFSRTRGATVYSDGLCEYEATDDGIVWVTLLRAVGQLSRVDLPERPGNAGWPTPTPGAQCQGPFGAALACMLHGPRTPAVVDAVDRTADDVLLPLTGATLRSALAVPTPVTGFALEGRGLSFGAVKLAEAEGWTTLRCVNLLDEAVTGVWRFGFEITEAWTARLDETPVAKLATGAASSRAVAFVAAPRQVVTILVR